MRSKSFDHRFEDYWLGLRLQNMDISAIQVVRGANDFQNNHAFGEELGELEEAMRRAFYEHFKKDIK